MVHRSRVEVFIGKVEEFSSSIIPESFSYVHLASYS